MCFAAHKKLALCACGPSLAFVRSRIAVHNNTSQHGGKWEEILGRLKATDMACQDFKPTLPCDRLHQRALVEVARSVQFCQHCFVVFAKGCYLGSGECPDLLKQHCHGLTLDLLETGTMCGELVLLEAGLLERVVPTRLTEHGWELLNMEERHTKAGGDKEEE